METLFLYIQQAFGAIFLVLQPYLPFILLAAGILIAWRIIAFSTRVLGLALVLIFCFWAFQTFFQPETSTAMIQQSEVVYANV